MGFNVSQPLYQQVYERIRKSILTGELKPGSKVVITRLAEKYGLSRTPLREALRQLQKEGLLIHDNNRTRVVSINAVDFKELYSCRLLLEKEIIKQITLKITEEEISRAEETLKQSCEAMKQGDYINFLHLNTKFHDILIYSCSNKRLVQLLDQVRSLLLIYRANLVIQSSELNHEVAEEHWTLIQAIKNRDKEKAVKAIETHLRNDMKRGKIFNN